MILSRQSPHHARILWTSGLWSTLLLSGLILSGQCEEIAIAAPPVKTAIVTADAVQDAFVRVAEKIKPSVVTIYAQRSTPRFSNEARKPIPKKPLEPPDPNELPPENPATPFPFSPREPGEDSASLGTGMVLNKQGQILTNYHVIKGATDIRVLFDDAGERAQRAHATLVGFDEESDLAVLQLEIAAPLLAALQPVEFADSDATRVGEWAIAIGAPFDQAQSVTVGVISAKGRHLAKENRTSLQDYLQTDASINPGNSGGPLVNLQGQVIGINTAILSPARYNVGIGFAVPANTIRDYLPLLSNGKSVARGFLGIQYVAIDAEVAREFGVAGGMQIGALAKRGEEFIGPAKKAGLLQGDIITKVNGREVIGSDDFRRLVAGSAPGVTLTFTVVRPTNAAQEMREFNVTLDDWITQTPPEEKPVAPLAEPKTTTLGLQIENADDLSVNERDFLGLPLTINGAIIVEVAPGSPADNSEQRRSLILVRARTTGKTWQLLPDKASFLRLENSLAPGARVLLQLRDKENISVYKLLVVPEKH